MLETLPDIPSKEKNKIPCSISGTVKDFISVKQPTRDKIMINIKIEFSKVIIE